MKHKDAAAVIKNAVQFLGPLADLARAAEKAAECEGFLAQVGPRVESLRAEHATAATVLAAVNVAIDTEKSRLEVLFRDGAADVRRRVADVERSFEDQLHEAVTAHSAALERLARERRQVESVLADLTTKRNELAGEVSRLESEAYDLHTELRSIAERAQRGA